MPDEALAAHALGRLAIAVTCALVPRVAAAIVDWGDGLLSLDGSIRTTALAIQNHDQDALFGADNGTDGLGDLTLRLVAEGRPTDRVDAEIHGVHRLVLVTEEAGERGARGLLAPGTSTMPYRIDDVSWHWAEDGRVDARLDLDRMNVRIALPTTDVTLGRQAITFGKAYFWNPLDVFLPFGANQFDRDYKAGVDAVRTDTTLGDYSGLVTVAALGDLDSTDLWYESAALARAFTNVLDWDLSVQGGKILGGYQAGGGVAGELAAIELRGEVAGFFAMGKDPLSDHVAAVAGLGRRFESTLHLQVEHFYNGASARTLQHSLELIASGRLLHANRHLTGILATYELHPLVNGSFATIFGWNDDSAIFQPGLVYSAANEVDLLAGAVVAIGRRPVPGRADGSEFGAYPNLYYAQAKIYF